MERNTWSKSAFIAYQKKIIKNKYQHFLNTLSVCSISFFLFPELKSAFSVSTFIGTDLRPSCYIMHLEVTGGKAIEA